MDDSSSRDEQIELQEDEEKLQIALQTYEGGWDSFSEEEEDENEEQLIIDLEREISESEKTAEVSNKSSFAETGSIPANANIADDDDPDQAIQLTLGLPSELAASEQQANPEQVLALNRALQGILEGHIEAIAAALEENKAKQRELEEEGNDLPAKTRKDTLSAPFRAPYFKSSTSFAPANEDVALKRQSQESDTSLARDYVAVRASSREILKQAVVEDCLAQLIRPILLKHEEEMTACKEIESGMTALKVEIEKEKANIPSELKAKKSEEKRKELKDGKKRIKDMEEKLEELKEQKKAVQIKLVGFERDIEEKKAIPEEDLLADVDSEKVDWMKISKLKFQGTTSWLDCQKAWEHVVRPDLNKSGWKTEEEKKLKELVAGSDNDWADIAQKLGTKRTPFQCFSHYQSHLNPELKSRKWTAEEEKRLLDVAAKVKASFGTYSWRKLSAFMDSRSPTECMIRMSKLDKSQNHGKWSYEEDAKLMAGVNLMGKCWSKVARFVGTRNMLQVRDRYTSSLAPNINFTHFTYDEDAKLLKLRKAKGAEWAAMCPFFNGRTDSQLLKRFKTLQKYKRQCESFDNLDQPTKDMLLGKDLPANERRALEMEMKHYLFSELGIVHHDYKRRQADLESGMDPDLVPPRPPFQLKTKRIRYNFEKNNYLSWLRKVQMHSHLSENMSRLIAEKQNQKKQPSDNGKGKKSRDQRDLNENDIREIIEETVQQTMKQRPDKMLNSRLTTKQYESLKGTLNKMFLGNMSVRVQDLIATCRSVDGRTLKKEKKGKTSLTYNQLVTHELKAFLQKSSRINSKFGRRRQFFAKDSRDQDVMEAEHQEATNSAPRTLVKIFGSSLDCLLTLIRLRKLDLEEQLANFPGYQEDPTFQTEMKYVEEVKERLSNMDGITPEVFAKKVQKVNFRARKLENLFKGKYSMQKSLMEEEIRSYTNDLHYLEGLAHNSETVGMEEEECMQLMGCHTTPESDSNFVLSSVVKSHFTPSTSSTSMFSEGRRKNGKERTRGKDVYGVISTEGCAGGSEGVDPQTQTAETDSSTSLLLASAASSSELSSSLPSSSTAAADLPPSVSTDLDHRSSSTLTKEDSSTVIVKEESPEPSRRGGESVLNEEFRVPAPKLTPGAGLSTEELADMNTESEKQSVAGRTRSRKRKANTEGLAQGEKTKHQKKGQNPVKPPPKRSRTLEEVLKEREEVRGDPSKKIYSKLPFLPPNLATLSALRSLLLSRTKLMKKAGNLYKSHLNPGRVRVSNFHEGFDHSYAPVPYNQRKMEQLLVRQRAERFAGLVPSAGYGQEAIENQTADLVPSALHGRQATDNPTAHFVPVITYDQVEADKGRLTALREETAQLCLNRQEMKRISWFPGIDVSNLPGRSGYQVVLSATGDLSRSSFDHRITSRLTSCDRPADVSPAGREDTLPAQDILVRSSAQGTRKTSPPAPIEQHPQQRGKTGEAGDDSNNADDVVIVKTIPQNFHLDSVPTSRDGSASGPWDARNIPQCVPSTSSTSAFLHQPSGSSEAAVLSTTNSVKSPTCFTYKDFQNGDKFLGSSACITLSSDSSDEEDLHETPALPLPSHSENVILRPLAVLQKPLTDVAGERGRSRFFEGEIAEIMARHQSETQHVSLTSNLPDDGEEEPDTMPIAPEKVQRLMKKHRLKNNMNKLVLVGVDQTGRKVVHYKTDSKTGNSVNFQPFEEADFLTPEVEGPKPPKNFNIKTVRQTEEYKLLLARFRALFTWPVLLSTMRPSPSERVERQHVVKKKTKKMQLPPFRQYKRSKARMAHLARLKARWPKNRLAEANRKQSKNADKTGTGLGDEEAAGPSSQKDPDAQALEKPKRRKHTKREHTKVEKNLRKRKEIDYKFPPLPKAPKPENKGASKAKAPRWWRDAMVAAMISKRKQEESAGDPNMEVNIESDDDFVDKGNYTDDEWLEELRKSEEPKVQKKRGRKRKVWDVEENGTTNSEEENNQGSVDNQ